MPKITTMNHLLSKIAPIGSPLLEAFSKKPASETLTHLCMWALTVIATLSLALRLRTHTSMVALAWVKSQLNWTVEAIHSTKRILKGLTSKYRMWIRNWQLRMTAMGPTTTTACSGLNRAGKTIRWWWGSLKKPSGPLRKAPQATSLSILMTDSGKW